MKKGYMILTLAALLGCGALGGYAYHLNHELGQYRHMYHQAVADVIAVYHQELNRKLGADSSAADWRLHGSLERYPFFYIIPREKDAEFKSAIEQMEEELELRLADFHGYLCPDLTVTLRELKPKTTAEESQHLVYEVVVERKGFRQPTPEEQQKIICAPELLKR